MAAKEIPPSVAEALRRVMPQEAESFIRWLKGDVVDVSNSTISDLAETDSNLETTNSNLSSLETTVSGKADSSHTHNLADMAEKSYTSLDDKPIADTADDGPSDATGASNVSAISCPTGTDQINRSTFNTSLTTLTTEINAINTKLSDLVTAVNALKDAHNDIIDELQAAGLMA